MSKAALAYYCRLHPKAGTLLPERCFELGVPPGPLYGQLKNGQDVTLPDGRVVLAADVRIPDDPGPAFLIVECPDESYLDNFVSEPKLCRLHPGQEGSDPLATPQVIVHFTSDEVVELKTFLILSCPCLNWFF